MTFVERIVVASAGLLNLASAANLVLRYPSEPAALFVAGLNIGIAIGALTAAVTRRH